MNKSHSTRRKFLAKIGLATMALPVLNSIKAFTPAPRQRRKPRAPKLVRVLGPNEGAPRLAMFLKKR